MLLGDLARTLDYGRVYETVRAIVESTTFNLIEALAEVRRIGAHEGWCYHHVQAILLAIDQYAEAATGNREYFWNKPHSAGGSRGDIP